MVWILYYSLEGKAYLAERGPKSLCLWQCMPNTGFMFHKANKDILPQDLKVVIKGPSGSSERIHYKEKRLPDET